MQGNVTISRAEYLSLRLSAEKLAMLEAGGVDNWEWYGESLWPGEGETYEDVQTQVEKEVEVETD